MRSSMMGLSAATAVAISVVALPPAIAAHSAATAAGPVRSVAAAPHAAADPVQRLAAADSYPTNTTSLTVKPLTRTYSGPATVTFTGRLALNGTGVQTNELRLFSVKQHEVVATVSTNRAGEWHATLKVSRSDWFLGVFSGNQNYQPALSGVSKITIGNRPAVR